MGKVNVKRNGRVLMAKELKADRIIREIQELQEELEQHQEKCQHRKATFEYGSNTGDPYSLDLYWRDWICPTCKKRWRESQ